jgi:hypothetical protein
MTSAASTRWTTQTCSLAHRFSHRPRSAFWHLASSLWIAYRKPCFAGDRVRAHVRLFDAAGTLGAAGFIAGPGEEGRPRCYVRVLMRA